MIKKYIETSISNAPDMGRAYQELAHINRDMGNEDKSIIITGKHASLTQLYCFMECFV